jgi:hypothetical protein
MIIFIFFIGDFFSVVVIIFRLNRLSQNGYGKEITNEKYENDHQFYPFPSNLLGISQ